MQTSVTGCGLNCAVSNDRRQIIIGGVICVNSFCFVLFLGRGALFGAYVALANGEYVPGTDARGG